MCNFEIVLIDGNNNDEHLCYLDEGKDMKYVQNRWYDYGSGLEGSRFYNEFVLAVLGNLLLNYEREEDIYFLRFKIGCYAYDYVGNVYVRTFSLEFSFCRAYIKHSTRR